MWKVFQSIASILEGMHRVGEALQGLADTIAQLDGELRKEFLAKPTPEEVVVVEKLVKPPTPKGRNRRKS